MEILVTITLIAILLALVVPSVASATRAARITKSTVNARELTRAITLYADMSRGYLPATTPGVPVPTDDEGSAVGYPPYQIDDTWSGVIANTLPLWEHRDAFFSPGLSRDVWRWPSSYTYAVCLAGDPIAWTPGVTMLGDVAVRRRIDQVRFPSSKSMLWDRHLGWLRREPNTDTSGNILDPTAIGMVDTSVRVRRSTEASAPVSSALHPMWARGRAMHDTRFGATGVDFSGP
jgi:type II secretory pathway pseudopilin PulG